MDRSKSDPDKRVTDCGGQRSRIGLALTSRSKPVTLTLDPESFSTNDLLITNPSSPDTQPSLTFTPDNWNESQTLYLEAVDETIDDNDKTIQVSFTVIVMIQATAH